MGSGFWVLGDWLVWVITPKVNGFGPVRFGLGATAGKGRNSGRGGALLSAHTSLRTELQGAYLSHHGVRRRHSRLLACFYHRRSTTSTQLILIPSRSSAHPHPQVSDTRADFVTRLARSALRLSLDASYRIRHTNQRTHDQKDYTVSFIYHFCNT